MKSDTVVGYTYRAEIICPSCVVNTMAALLPEADLPRLEALREEFGPSETAEGILAVASLMLGIDRMNESSYDSDEFPKVIFADQAEGETCDTCEEALL